MRTLAISAIAAAGVFVLLFALQARTGDTASVVVALDEDQVSWPYHDAVRQSATGAISSSAEALAAANAGAAPGTVSELSTEMHDGQSYFKVSAAGSDSEAAAAGIDAVMIWAIEQNLAERVAPLDAETEQLTAEIATLTAEYEELKGSDDALTSARASEAGSLAAEFERRLVVVEAERNGILPQFSQIEPASPENSPLRPVFSALGAFLALLIALTLLEPTASTAAKH